LLGSPAGADMQGSPGFEANLREASSAFNGARAAAWRFAVTSEPEQRALTAQEMALATDSLKRARALATEKQVRAGVDGLVAAADRFKNLTEDAVKTEEAKRRVLTEQVLPAAKEIGVRLTKAVAFANEYALSRRDELLANLTWVGNVARNVSEAAKGTAEVAEKITQVNRGASATGSASTQVLASARLLSKESSNLKTEVENFLNTVRAA
jgi:hypothetical protein